jgi:hypothetical protein
MSDRPEDSEHHAPGPTIIDVVAETVRPRWPLRALLIAGLPLAAAMVLLAAAPFWAPPLARLLPWSSAPPTTSADPALFAGLDRLEQKLGALAERQAALESQVTRLAARPVDTGSANASVLQEQAAAMRLLADRLTQLEQRPGAPAPVDNARELAALASELRQLGERLAALETRAAAPAPVALTIPAAERTDQALLLALGRVREALAAERPFAAELATLQRLGHDRPDVSAALPPLAAAAPTGVAAVAVLAKRFSQEVAPAVMRETAVPESGSWSDRLLAKLGGLVSIRRVGESAIKSGDPVEAALARAEAALAAGDLAAAIVAAESLPEPARVPAQAWLAQARLRLGAMQAVASLDDALAARLAADAVPAPER